MYRNLHASLHHPVSREWSSPHLHSSDLVYPLFVSTRTEDKPISGFEPNIQWGSGETDNAYGSLLSHLEELVAKGLRSVMLFGVVEEAMKDAIGTAADTVDNPVVLACSRIRKQIPKLLIMCDVCLCEYTDHGHCGFLRQIEPLHHEDESIDTLETSARLARVSLAYAKAGAHYVCPSDMMDGRIKAIRTVLDNNGYQHVGLMAYTSKKASSMYAPFRQAVESTFKGDRMRYQHPVGSSGHAMRALSRDMEEGADIVLVKPALFYGDIIAKFKENSNLPVAAYVVSGEYVMLLKYGESSGCLEQVLKEAHVGLKRAGASVLVTYFTPLLLDLLQKW